jgi:hypothetical protein
VFSTVKVADSGVLRVTSLSPGVPIVISIADLVKWNNDTTWINSYLGCSAGTNATLAVPVQSTTEYYVFLYGPESSIDAVQLELELGTTPRADKVVLVPQGHSGVFAFEVAIQDAVVDWYKDGKLQARSTNKYSPDHLEAGEYTAQVHNRFGVLTPPPTYVMGELGITTQASDSRDHTALNLSLSAKLPSQSGFLLQLSTDLGSAWRELKSFPPTLGGTNRFETRDETLTIPWKDDYQPYLYRLILTPSP